MYMDQDNILIYKEISCIYQGGSIFHRKIDDYEFTPEFKPIQKQDCQTKLSQVYYQLFEYYFVIDISKSFS